MKRRVDAEVHWLVRNQKQTTVLENIRVGSDMYIAPLYLNPSEVVGWQLLI
jgi:hypothetical protein